MTQNPFNDAADQFLDSGAFSADPERETRKRLFEKSLQSSMWINPEQAAEGEKLSESTGLPRDYVKRNTERAKMAERMNQVDVDTILDESPVTAEFLSNPDNAGQSSDDIPSLTKLEGLWKQSKGVGKSMVSAPLKGFELGFGGISSIADAITRQTLSAADAVLPESADSVLYPELSDFNQGLVNATNPFYASEGTSQMMGEFSEAFKLEEGEESYVGDIAGAVTQTASLALMTAINPVVGTTLLFGMGVGEQTQRQEEAGIYGEDLSSDAALLAGGAFQAVIERVGLDRILRRMPDVVKNRIMRRFTDIAATAGIEGAQEGLEQAGQNLIEYAYYNPDARMFDGVQENAQLGGWAGGILRSIMLASGAGRRRLASDSDAGKINETISAIEQSALAGRNRGMAREFMEALGDDTGSDTVYIDSDAAEVLFQTVGNADPAALQTPAMQRIIDQIPDSLESGSKLQVPLADLTELVQNGGARAVQQNMTSSVDSLSPSEQSNVDINEEINLIKEMGIDGQQESQEVFDEVVGMRTAMGVDREQAEKDGIYWEAFFRTLSKKQGVDQTAIEIFRQANPSMGYQVDPELQAQSRRIDQMDNVLNNLRAGRVPTDQEIYGESLTQFIRKEGGILDEGGEMAARDAKSLIRNKTGRSLDSLAERAVEEGFMQEQDINALIELIDSEIRGNPTYRLGTENDQLLNTRTELDQLQDLLDQSELDITSLNNDQIRQALNIPSANPETTYAQDGQPVAPVDQLDDGVTVVPESGLRLLHGSEQSSLSVDDIQIVRTGQKQGKKGRSYGGFYTTSVADSAQAVDYAAMKDGSVFDIIIAPGTKILRKDGDITRLSEKAINGWVEDGVGLVIGIDPRGRTEYVVIDKNAIQSINSEVTQTNTIDGNARNGVTLYHGTDSGALGQIAIDGALKGPVYFTPRKDLAEEYADGGPVVELSIAESELKIDFDLEGGRLLTVPEANQYIEKEDWTINDYLQDGQSVGVEDDIAVSSGQILSDEEVVEFSARNTGITSDENIEDTNPDILFSRTGQRNLFVAHNLSEENLQHALDLGGLAAPSLAVGRTDRGGFNDFGDITLLAPSSILESSKARTFDADIYSPRHPRAEYKIDHSAFLKQSRGFENEFGLALPQMADVERNGMSDMARSPAYQHEWLRSQGKAPKAKPKKADPAIKKLAKLGLNRYELVNSPKAMKIAEAHYREEYEAFVEVAGRPDAWRQGIYFEEDGSLKPALAQDLMLKAERYKDSGGVDTGQIKHDINKKMRQKSAQSQYEQWIQEKFNEINEGPRLFGGITNAGNRRYKPYNLDTVVKEMTRELQGGEGFNYASAGSVRASFATEMKRVKQVQANRDRIVSPEAMEQVKEESGAKLEQALDALKPYYKFDADGFGYNGDASSAIAEGVRGQRETFNLDTESRAIIKDLTDYLRELPTEYFETKIGRAVDLSEFSVALVPKGTSTETVQALRDKGLTVKRYDSGDPESRRKAVANEEALLFQRGRMPGEPAGDVANPANDMVRGMFDRSQNRITFTKNANYSTFVHESSHFFLEVMRSFADQSAEVRSDLDMLEKWAQDQGAKSDRDIHEMFASGFETYTMEGKAPTAELQPIFNRFRIWLNEIYKRLSEPFRQNNLGGVELSDEVRAIMDRMLATQEEIDQAKADAGMGPRLSQALGLTAQEAVEYESMVAAAEEEAIQDLTSKVMGEYQRERKRWWKSELADEKKIVAGEVDSQRVYRLRDALTGDRPVEGMPDQKLNTSFINENYNTFARQLSRMTAKDGTNPELVATMYGYADAGEMIEDLINSRNKVDRDKYIKAEAETRMRRRHGDSMTDGSLAQMADKAVHTGKQSEVLHRELEYINAKTGKKTIKRQIYREAARQLINSKKIKDIKPSLYLRQEQTARNAAVRTAQAGKMKESAVQMDKAMRQHYLYREALIAAEQSGKLYKFGKSLTRGGRLATLRKAGDSYLAQVDSILGWLELKRVSDKDLGRRVSMTDWINAQMDKAGAGDPNHSDEGLSEYEIRAKKLSMADDPQRMSPKIGVTEDMMALTERVNYRELTPEQTREVKEMLDAIYHLAKLKDKLITNQDERTLDEWVDRLEVTLEENANDQKVQTIGSNRPKGERTKEFWKSMFDMNRTPTSLIRMLDGFGENGDAWQLLGQPLQDASSKETIMLDKANRKLEEIFSAYGDAELADWDKYVPGVNGRKITKQGVVSIFLNWGNAGNRDRVMDGFNLTSQQVNYLFDQYITEKDVKLAKDLWSYLDTFREPAFALHRDLFGFTPAQVEASPFMTQFGEVPGGYFPIQYDPVESARAEQQQLTRETDSTAKSIASRNKMGSNQARSAKVSRAIKTDVTQVVYGHLTDVIHSVTHDRALYDVGRILGNDRVKASIQNNFGDHIYKSMVSMIREVKEGGDEVRTAMDRTVQWARNNTTLAMLGASIRTIILQPFGVTNSIAKARMSGMGTAPLMNAYAKFLHNPVDQAARIKEKSIYMQQREQVMSVAINRITQKIRSRGKLNKLTELGMIPIQKMQFYTVDAPMWLATHTFAIDRGVGENDAVSLADQAVRDAQGAGSVVDTAQSMRGGPWQKLFTNFLTYMITTNSLYQESKAMKKRGDITLVNHAVNTLVMLTVPAILTALLNDLVAGEDDEQSFLDRFLREQLSFLMSMNPLSAQFAGAVNGFDYSGPQGTALISKVGNLAKQMEQGEIDRNAFKATIEVIGLSTGLPSSQFNRLVFGTLKGIEEGDSAAKIIKQGAFGPER